MLRERDDNDEGYDCLRWLGLGGNLVTTTILFTTINAQEKAVLKTEVTVVSVVWWLWW